MSASLPLFVLAVVFLAYANGGKTLCGMMTGSHKHRFTSSPAHRTGYFWTV